MKKYILTILLFHASFITTTIQANTNSINNNAVVNSEASIPETIYQESTSTETNNPNNDAPLVSTSSIESGEAIGLNTELPNRAPFNFLVDYTLSPIVGANALISALHAYSAFDDACIPSSEGSTEWNMVLGRLAKYTLEGILISWGMVAQHEFFGHGARAREFNISVLNYNILPFSGHTTLRHLDIKNLSPSERNALYTGGVEATYILGKELRNSWLQTKCMDERESHAYVINAFDQTFYVLRTRHRHGMMGNDDGDIHRYVHQLNRWYGKTVLTTRDLRQKILFDFLDPYFFYSWYSIGSYWFVGTMKFEYPMIPIGCYHYLPGFRIALAPYGPEYQLINYIRGPEHTVQVTMRYGKTGERKSYGLTIETHKLWQSDLLTLDTKLDIWNQPRLFVRKAFLAEDRFGIAAVLIGRYRIGSCVDIIGQLGYKTAGYIPGEFLRRTPIVRLGISMQL